MESKNLKTYDYWILEFSRYLNIWENDGQKYKTSKDAFTAFDGKFIKKMRKDKSLSWRIMKVEQNPQQSKEKNKPYIKTNQTVKNVPHISSFFGAELINEK